MNSYDNKRGAPGKDELKRTQRCKQLADRPPDGQHGQEIPRIEGQELEEQSAIDGQISAHPNAHAGVQGGDADPAVRARHGGTKNPGEKEGGVEGGASADDVGRDAPEGGSDAESDEGGTGGVAHLDRRDAIFFRDGWQRECQTLVEGGMSAGF